MGAAPFFVPAGRYAPYADPSAGAVCMAGAAVMQARDKKGNDAKNGW